MPPDEEVDRNDALADAIGALPANTEEEAPPPEPVEAPPPEPAPPATDYSVQVPLSKYDNERKRRQAAEARIAELERLHGSPQPPPVAPAPAAAEAPSVKFEDNPAEWLKQNTEIQARRLEAQEKELQKRVKAYEEETQREQQQRQQAEYIARLDSEYRNAWSERAQQEPEALEAHSFFANQFIAEAMAIGRTRQQADQMLIHAERQLAYEAFTNDINPADLIIARARARGWGQQATAVQSQQGGAAPAPAAAPAVGQRKGSKLSAASGAAAPTMLSLHEIASMPRDEYGRWRKKNPDGFEKLIGAG